MHQDATLLAPLIDLLAAIVTANVLDKPSMASAQVCRHHLPFAHIPFLSGTKGFTKTSSLIVLPQFAILL
jgi:hypothetical protein